MTPQTTKDQQTVITHPDAKKIHANFAITLQNANSLQITNSESYRQAGEVLKALKGAISIIKGGDPTSNWEGFDGQVKAAFDTHKFLVKLRDMAVGPYEVAYTSLNSRTMGYEVEQRRKAEEEAKRAQEAARKAEEERQLIEAIEAEKAGDKKAAEEILAAPVVAPVIAAIPAELPKIEGRSVRYNYSGQCVDLMSLLRHIIAHPEDLSLVEVNQTALNARARSQRDGFTLPGCKVEKTPVASMRAI